MPRVTNSSGAQDFDLRVIELSKSSSANTLKSKLEAEDANGYVCLGHFDYIQVAPLPGSSPLEAIETDFKARDNYSCPLYIFHYSLLNRTVLDNFWSIKSCFMTVSRIHFTPNAQNRAKLLRSALEDLHQGPPLVDKQFGELSIRVLDELVHMVFYYTLELGDLVVVLKSNSIMSCMEAIRRMMEVSQVGDVYSFCGIHGRLCHPDVDKAVLTWKKEVEEKQQQTCFQKDISDAMSRTIPHAGMRFSVISTRNAKVIWADIGCTPYFISGTADALIDLKNVTVKQLVKYISTLAIRTFDAGGGRRISMYDAFEDIITRIGGEYGEIYKDALPLGPCASVPALKEAQIALKEAVRRIQEESGGSRWFPILLAQTDTLITMMGNCITDDLSILIWPSVQALMERLLFLLKNAPPISARQEAEIGEFLNSWDILENDISRMEGQLSQKPELLSGRYYTPATLLAFYTATLFKCNDLLLTINQDTNHGYVPLIIYNVEPRASTHCILDPSKNDPAVAYKGKTPLLVSLPVSMLYRPMETVIVLCHELSHYTGSSTRFRKDRYKHILASCAELISIAWMLDGRKDFPLIPSGRKSILNDLIKKMDQLYPKPHGECTQYYIKELDQNLFMVLLQVFYDEQFHSELMQHYLLVKDVQHCVFRYARSIDAHQQYERLYKIRKRVNNILLLYRECYADLMAILILDLCPEDYLLNIFYRETQYIEEMASGNSANRVQELQLQAALVLYTLQKEFTFSKAIDLSDKQSEWLRDWENAINYYQGAFPEAKDIMKQDQSGIIMYQGEYANLLDYLADCKKAVEERLKDQKIQMEREPLIQMLKIVKDPFDLEKIHEEVEKYRCTLLES